MPVTDPVTPFSYWSFLENHIDKKDLEFGYRHSVLQRKDLIVSSVEMELRKGIEPEITRRMERNLERRKKNQPIDLRSAGSIFRNPPDNYAGRLIEVCGCKGMRIGDAKVSDLHANFIINVGNATAQDVLGLMRHIRDKVLQNHGIDLEPEIKIVGRGTSWKNLN